MNITLDSIVDDLVIAVPKLANQLVTDQRKRDSGKSKDYRYARNTTQRLFRITLMDESAGIYVDDAGHAAFVPFTPETYDYVRPVIIQKIDARIQELEAQIHYTDSDSILVIRPSGAGNYLMELTHKGAKYCATGPLDNALTFDTAVIPLAVLPLYLKCLQDYFLPYIQKAGGKASGTTK